MKPKWKNKFRYREDLLSMFFKTYSQVLNRGEQGGEKMGQEPEANSVYPVV